MEAMQKLVDMYGQQNRTDEKFKMQDRIIEADAKAGAERSARTKYLAANATLELAYPEYEAYIDIKVWPNQRPLTPHTFFSRTGLEALAMGLKVFFLGKWYQGLPEDILQQTEGHVLHQFIQEVLNGEVKT